ncbi:putative mucin-associated surface protein (MASP) [Trypanosoma cruzi]|uniref:Mucin-associated surface protein (MASP), putative n=2 Tax=Trypanosoma cruzi TaxID=5693 RepID=Q4D7K9_TRYCC|nr:mucin-associated surface protein (MASP), putative [Trypanosoma cruzi]EAN88512.1 mucin-associated surface protein (MASP), putative [Trypanosoma cruzi]PWV12286.1 putative mucin-associated surface protein (MASP) [Trypanosoma cruzi]|eukprot:XP_810363.1 mucin-associated surface protein (MASP) [Trypanosoma cruzi strain CL Brener]
MAMMAGRVLLVCALCVLWCGAGGGCDEEVVEAAAGGLLGTAGKGTVETSGTSTPGPDGSDLPKGLPKVNQPTETSTGKSLEVNKVNVDQQDVAPGVGDEEDGSPSDHLEEPLKDDPEKGKTKPELQNKGQEGREPPQLQVTVPQQPQPPLQQSQPPSAPQPQPSASEKGEVVGENNKGGEGQLSLGVEHKGSAAPEAPRKEDLLEGSGKESENNEPVQTTVPNKVPPEHKTQNGMLTPEQKTNESQGTDTSMNLPEIKKENKEYSASTKSTAPSTSTGSQEQEAEPSTSEEPSPFEEEQSTVTKKTEDARTPDAAATEKRQNGANEKDGDSDSSTAVSDTTSPLLLLLLVVACAAAAVVAA